MPHAPEAGLYAYKPPGGAAEVIARPSREGVEIYTAAAAGDWVLWGEATDDMVLADWRLFGKNLVTGETREVDAGQLDPSEAGVGTMTFLAPLLSASGTTVVWSTFEPHLGKPAAVVRAYDASTGRSRILDLADDPSAEDFDHPHVSGGHVLYSKGRLEPDRGGKYGVITTGG